MLFRSVSVLKGGAAAALYGSRASNGVIIITTKNGLGSEGLGIEINSTAQFDMLNNSLWDAQTTYGSGANAQVPSSKEDAGIVEEDAESPEEGELWEEEALVVDDDPPDTREKVDEVLSRIGDVVEAEVVEAEVITQEPEREETALEPVILGEDDQPSLVISMPTLSSLGNRWKAVVAVFLVTILVGAAATVFLQRSSGFTVSKLRFGESMDFQVIDSSVSISGEEMLGIVRDSSGGILDPACGEFTMEMDGTGTVLVTDGPESGAVETTDSLGRTGLPIC